MSPLLQVDRLSVRFGGVIAADQLSFAVGEGELLGLIGPNGAGKTTALRLIAGLVAPESGAISFAGRDIGALPTHERIRAGLAITHQIVRPFASLSVAENVMIAAGLSHTQNPGAALFTLSRAAERRRALAILDRVGLADVADRKPRTLPLGRRKRLEVARALALQPKLLLLDEPMAGLSSAEASSLGDTILGLNRDGLAILLIEHNLGEVTRIVSRLIVLDAGKVIADGAPAEVMRDPAVQLAYIGAAAPEAAGGAG